MYPLKGLKCMFATLSRFKRICCACSQGQSRTLGVVGVAGGGALSQGTEKNLGSAFPGIVISWKQIQLNNIIICNIPHIGC